MHMTNFHKLTLSLIVGGHQDASCQTLVEHHTRKNCNKTKPMSISKRTDRWKKNGEIERREHTNTLEAGETP